MRFLLVLTVAAAWAQDAPSFVNEGVVNAPVAEVWKVFSTSKGYTALGVALAEVDLRVGGLIRSRYGADGKLGDEETIENLILARRQRQGCQVGIGLALLFGHERRAVQAVRRVGAEQGDRHERRRILEIRGDVMDRRRPTCRALPLEGDPERHDPSDECHARKPHAEALGAAIGETPGDQ